MKLLIVTGMSGSGKSKALSYLEDNGYYCLDNLPMNLLPLVIEWELKMEDFPTKVAVTADVRNYDIYTEIDKVLEAISKKGVDVRILFLECDDGVLLKRYKETRRIHPLMGWEADVDIATAIKAERKILERLRLMADYVVDTSLLSTSRLREKLLDMLADESSEDMLVDFIAFGYKYGIPADADVVFDVRCLPNPFYQPELKELTGADREVQDFIMSTEQGRGMMDRIRAFLEYSIPLYKAEGKGQLVVAIGCTGGQHRSMTFAKLLSDYFAGKGLRVRFEARDAEKNKLDIASLFRGFNEKNT